MKFIFIYRIIPYLCEKLNVMPQTFEQMQFIHELQQGQDFDSTDHSKVDHLKPHNWDCGSFTHRYGRQPSHLDADSNEQEYDLDNQ